MIIELCQNEHYLKNLNSKARERNRNGVQLAKIHEEIGSILGKHLANSFPFKNTLVENSQGKENFDTVVNLENVTLVCLMRAGLYVALGVRSIFEDDKHVFLLSNSEEDLALEYINDKHVIIIDSVINTGQSIRKYLDYCTNAKSLSVLSIVVQDKFVDIANLHYPEVKFYISRISSNYYVGSGGIDTGNRLFGTF